MWEKMKFQNMINKVICGDCLEVIRDIPDESVDLVVTDPPYGIGAEKGTDGFGECKNKVRRYKDKWQEPKKEWFNEILRVSKNAIIFGGNYYTHWLPLGKHWIVWDKTGTISFKNPFSKCELAWTNIDKNMVEKYTYIQQGFICEEKIGKHPTQKPLPLIINIVTDYSQENSIILDPFLGSGTTAVACKQLNRNFIGIEINPDYCKIARKRLEQEPIRDWIEK